MFINKTYWITKAELLRNSYILLMKPGLIKGKVGWGQGNSPFIDHNVFHHKENGIEKTVPLRVRIVFHQRRESGIVRKDGPFQTPNMFLTEVKTKHSEPHLLGCNAMQFAGSQPFQKNILPPSSSQPNCESLKSYRTLRTEKI